MGAFFTVFGSGAGSYADASDVRFGVDRGDGVTGTLVLPALSDVRLGVSYGASGEYTGTLRNFFTASEGLSEFSSLLETGFAEVAAQTGSTLTFNALTARVVAAEALISRELQDAGLWETGSQVVEITRTDFERLDLHDRARVTHAGKAMQLFVIGDDPADPMVRLQLKPAHDA